MSAFADQAAGPRLTRASWAGTLVCAAVLLCSVAVGYSWRFVPMQSNNGFDFQNDSAFNYRMCLETIRTGHPPRLDPLSIHPHGKRVYDELPVAMYYGASFFNRVMEGLGFKDAKMNIARFNALCGALIAVPVFLIALALTQSRTTACFAAFLAATIPLGLWRTHMSYLRQEVLGITLGMTYLAFWLRALSAKDDGTAFRNAAAAAFFLWLSLAAWRLNLVLYIISVIAFLFCVSGERERSRCCKAFLVTAAGYVLGCLTIPYLAAQKTLVSSESAIVMVAAAAAIYLPRSPFEGRRLERLELWIYRSSVVGVVLALTALFLSFSTSEAGVGVSSVFKLALSRLGYLRSGEGDILLYSSSIELAPLGLDRLFGRGHLSFSILLLLLNPFWSRERNEPDRRPDIATQTALFYTLVTFVLTVLVASRNMTLFSPMVCVMLTLGLAETLRTARTQGRSERRAAAARFLGAVVILGVSMVCAATAKEGYDLMRRLNPKSLVISPEDRRVYDYIRHRTSPKAVFWTQWSDGYPVQTYGRRATITDGLFEVPEVRRRVVEEARVMVSQDERKLADFCIKYGVDYVLFDRKYAGSYARYLKTSVVSAEAPPENGKLPPSLFLKPNQLRHFELVISSKALLLYRFHRDPSVKDVQRLLPDWLLQPNVRRPVKAAAPPAP